VTAADVHAADDAMSIYGGKMSPAEKTPTNDSVFDQYVYGQVRQL
jgi:hypothetical protein